MVTVISVNATDLHAPRLHSFSGLSGSLSTKYRRDQFRTAVLRGVASGIPLRHAMRSFTEDWRHRHDVSEFWYEAHPYSNTSSLSQLCDYAVNVPTHGRWLHGIVIRYARETAADWRALAYETD